MARADSSIRVNIIGDARSLEKASDKAGTSVGGIGKKAAAVGGIIAGAFAVDAVLDFAQVALGEADRVADATGRLEEQLGDLSKPLIDAADDFTNLGQSEGDMLELQARIADMGTAAQIADEKLAPMATTVAETAAALALITDMDAATVVDLIGKAAAGGVKPLKDLGISLTDAEVEARAMRDTGKETAGALTDGELAAARLQVILEKLAPRVQGVTDAEADLEQRQATVQAKFETLTGKIGEALEGPLNDLLGWILGGIEGFEILAANIGDMDDALREATGGALGFLDVVKQILSRTPGLGGIIGGFLPGSGGGHIPSNHATRMQTGGGGGVTVHVQGGSPEAVEQAVRRAIVHAQGHGPLE